MKSTGLPPKTQEYLLIDAAQRDRTTARRTCLLNIIWQERYLTRSHLIVRVEGELGKGCFGNTAWEDTFYRDMSIVKRALRAAGYRLAYSRSSKRPGYYLLEQPPLGAELSAILDGSISEVNPDQIAIYHRMSQENRLLQGFSISDIAREVVAYRTQKRNPELSLAEASRLTLQERNKG